MKAYTYQITEPDAEYSHIGVGRVVAMGRYEAATIALEGHSCPVGKRVSVQGAGMDAWEFDCTRVTRDNKPFLERVVS